MQYGIIAFHQGVGSGTRHSGDLLPLLRLDIGRDVHRTAVADDKHRLRADLGKTHKLVFECQLRLQDSPLSLIIQVAVRRQVVPAGGTIDGRYLRHVEHLVAESREVFSDLHQCRSLTGTRSSRQYDLLDIRHYMLSSSSTLIRRLSKRLSVRIHSLKGT